MALSALALVSLDETKQYLDIAQGGQDAVLETLIDRASALAEHPTLTNRPLKARTYTDLRLPAQAAGALYPPAIPIDVTAPVTVTLSGTALTVWRTEADGEPSGFDVLCRADHLDGAWRPDHFYRGRGWPSASAADPSPIRLSYTGGLATVPDLLKEAVFLIIAKMYRDQILKHADMVQISTPVGILERPDTQIPARARDILQSYRRILV